MVSDDWGDSWQEEETYICQWDATGINIDYHDNDFVDLTNVLIDTLAQFNSPGAALPEYIDYVDYLGGIVKLGLPNGRRLEASWTLNHYSHWVVPNVPVIEGYPIKGACRIYNWPSDYLKYVYVNIAVTKS